MKYFTKNNLKKHFIDMWIDDELTNREKGFYSKEVSKLVDEIYDLSITAVKPLNEQETTVIRKRYGVFDFGKKQTHASIGRSIKVSTSRAGQIVDKVHNTLLSRIFVISSQEEFTNNKMTSLDNNVDKDILKNKSIGELKLNPVAHTILKRFGVYTLGGLLSYSIDDLKRILGNKSLNELIDKVHEVGALFIEELPLKDKREIIARTSHDKVMNSSINWIELSTSSSYWLRDDHGINDLGGIKALIETSSVRVSPSIITNAKLIGLNFHEKWINKENDGQLDMSCVPIDELLDTTVIELYEKDYLDARTKNCLVRSGIFTIKEIISKTKTDIKHLRNAGIKSYSSIVDTMHEFGLLFADEAKVVKFYSDAIVEGLEETTTTPKIIEYNLKKDMLVERYNQLKRERSSLYTSSRLLDEKIKEALSSIKNDSKVKVKQNINN